MESCCGEELLLACDLSGLGRILNWGVLRLDFGRSRLEAGGLNHPCKAGIAQVNRRQR